MAKSKNGRPRSTTYDPYEYDEYIPATYRKNNSKQQSVVQQQPEVQSQNSTTQHSPSQRELAIMYRNGELTQNTNTTPQTTDTTPQTTDTANPVPTVPTVQENQKNAENAAAYASYQRMLKYLPQLNKESGYAGLGVSEAAKTEAWNDFQTRLAQIAMYYDQSRGTTSESALDFVKGELSKATTKEQYQNTLNMYRNLISSDDSALLEAIGNSTSDELYKQNAQYQALSEKGYSNSGGASFNSNKSRWLGSSKWTVGDGFTVKDSSGNKYAVEIAEVNPGKDDNALLSVANQATTGDVFLYGNDLYMVMDMNNKGGELQRVLFKLKQSGKKAKEFGDLVRLYKDIS